jgi:acetyltransferase-like isoleucine patch superfamily enzyme
VTKTTYYWSKIFKKTHSKAIKNSVIHKDSKVKAGNEIINYKFEKHSFCGYYCEIINTDIGSFSSIGNHIVIGGEMHPKNGVSTSPVFYEVKNSVKEKFSKSERPKPLRDYVGNDVWIGERAIINQGVKIGTGSTIGTGNVVVREVPPYTIVRDCPAKVIRKRFIERITKDLLNSSWWGLPKNSLRNSVKFIKTPELCLKSLNS